MSDSATQDRNTEKKYETLLFELDEQGIALVTMNRPDELNSVNMQMRLDFTALMDEIFFNNDIKVVIFTGAGRGFSGGGDMSHFEHDWVTPEFRANSRRLTKFFDDLEAVEKPIIVAINGMCTGAGFELALAADIRIASDQARIGFRENFISLIPGVGGTTRLVREIGPARAKEMIWTGSMYPAEEVYQMGFLNKVVPHEELLPAAREYAQQLLKRAPQSLGLAKKLINNIPNMDQTAAIAVEGLAQSILLKTQDHKEGVQAFREKRRPQFKGK
ncbi:hypothetical protein E5F05_00475 (plasmid) [Deinococcus metallilatus]|uniref:Enoyl-CoA hydratase/carnithine racemase n=1 Tax=Deinococcus metallilatus TaxID=1211322 RepID=A0AAJ5F7B5_9DEIO|nr:enoyl-CoA hydratase-related protein [Deinococcus metallilatus]MBB5293373.1 enoyl-CoA hydratase/carnithine racemase [Deinococcus metallilatus]QBY06475.1 hypothetical protein E5F05_00475 [Deinococcus metallilatus]RXJ17818.1 hypothetical protein ERJ73_00085 [Deinococcus metallilatus]TLK32090.1 hypothetical protein FCS05_01105 [Deinococcus metallilatus]GMA15404.1 hypothetical protein GCM10025871_17350 [Deinococcus metallilatus]